MKTFSCMLAALLFSAGAAADAVDRLRDFVREVQSGQSAFTQTVTSADGVRKKISSGNFEFARPNRFRFSYTKPFEQLIVADGVKVWIYDADLNQASSRRLAQALGSTPAALLAGSLIGGYVGSHYAIKKGNRWIKRAFEIVTILIGLKLIIS